MTRTELMGLLRETPEDLIRQLNLPAREIVRLRRLYGSDEDAMMNSLRYRRDLRWRMGQPKPWIDRLVQELEACGVTHADMPRYVQGMYRVESREPWCWRRLNTLSKKQVAALLPRLAKNPRNIDSRMTMTVDEAYASLLGD